MRDLDSEIAEITLKLNERLAKINKENDKIESKFLDDLKIIKFKTYAIILAIWTVIFTFTYYIINSIFPH